MPIFLKHIEKYEKLKENNVTLSKNIFEDLTFLGRYFSESTNRI